MPSQIEYYCIRRLWLERLLFWHLALLRTSYTEMLLLSTILDWFLYVFWLFC